MNERVIFDEAICKSCGLCISVCPTEIISFANHLNAKGYRPAIVEDQESCISCTKCALICPDSVITVFRPEKKKKMVAR